MCTGKIEKAVPNGPFDMKVVEGRCGQTGIHGSPVFCEECEADGTAQKEHQRIWEFDFGDDE